MAHVTLHKYAIVHKMVKLQTFSSRITEQSAKSDVSPPFCKDKSIQLRLSHLQGLAKIGIKFLQLVLPVKMHHL